VRRFTSILVDTADFGYPTEITLQGVLNREYTLRLFIENEELEVQTQDNQTWTLAQRPCVHYFSTTYTLLYLFMYRGLSPTSEIRVEIRMRSGKFLWAKNRQAVGVINLQALFNDYWSSNENEFTVPSQS